MASIPSKHEYDEYDPDEDTQPYEWHAPLQEPLSSWQDQQKAAQRERITANLRLVMAEDSRKREFLNTGVNVIYPLEEEPPELQTEYRMVGWRSLRRSLARLAHRIGYAIYEEAS